MITNTVNVAMELSARKGIDVFVTGGHLRGDWFSLVGPAAIASVNGLFADVLFVGVNGMDAHRGLTCLNSDEADINRASCNRQSARLLSPITVNSASLRSG